MREATGADETVRSRERAVVVACAAVCAGIAAAVELRPPVAWVAGLGAAACAALVVAMRVETARRAAAVAGIVLACAAAGAARGGGAADDLERRGALAAALPGPGTVVGLVRDAPVARRGQSVVVVDVERTSGDPGAEGAVALAVKGRSDLLPGDEVSVEVSRLRAPDDRPGALSAAALTRQGVDAVAVAPTVTLLARGGPSVARLVAQARSGVAADVDAAAPDPQAPFLDALAFGIHQPLPAAVSQPLQDSGLAHLEATSGLKVAIVAALVGRLLALVAAGPRFRGAATIAAMAGFVVLAGGGAAAVRSAVMATATLGLRRSGRRVRPVALLSLVAAAMLLVDPLLCRDLGFELSFLGTLGILLAAGDIAARIPGPRPVAEAAAVTLAAQCATLPIQGAAFGSVSIVGPLANAVAIPLVPPIVALAWTGMALARVSPVIGAPFLWAAAQLAGAILRIAGLAAAVPGAAIRPGAWPTSWTWAAVLVSAGAAGLWWWLATRAGSPLDDEPRRRAAQPAQAASRDRRRVRSRAEATVRHRRPLVLGGALAACAAAPLLALAAARPDGRLHVDVLDVGAGPAVLVRTAAGGLALVDAGPDPARLLTALGSTLPPLTRTIDAVLLTGGEQPATAGLVGLDAHYRIGRVVVPDADLGTATRAAVLSLRESGADVVSIPVNQAWRWDGATWRCAGPDPPPDPPPATSPVCALQVADGASTVLVLGDIGTPAQEELTATDGDGLRSQLLVGPPDGLLDPTLAAAAVPRLFAIPCSRAPRTRALDVPTRTTAQDGTLRYAGGPGGIGGAP